MRGSRKNELRSFYQGEEQKMSKYDALWRYIQPDGSERLVLTFDEIGEIAGMPIDHSFLKYKKELYGYGYEVGKISMKAQEVVFVRTERR